MTVLSIPQCCCCVTIVSDKQRNRKVLKGRKRLCWFNLTGLFLCLPLQEIWEPYNLSIGRPKVQPWDPYIINTIESLMFLIPLLSRLKRIFFHTVIFSVNQLNITPANQKQLVLILCGVLLLFSSFIIRIFSLWTIFTLSLLLVCFLFVVQCVLNVDIEAFPNILRTIVLDIHSRFTFYL